MSILMKDRITKYTPMVIKARIKDYANFPWQRANVEGKIVRAMEDISFEDFYRMGLMVTSLSPDHGEYKPRAGSNLTCHLCPSEIAAVITPARAALESLRNRLDKGVW